MKHGFTSEIVCSAHVCVYVCLQVVWPPGLEVVEVRDGFAVLRCKGLYEVKLSLRQAPYPAEAMPASGQQQQEPQAAASEAAEAATSAPTPCAPSAVPTPHLVCPAWHKVWLEP